MQASQSFICRCCKVDRPITDGLNADLHLDISNGVSLASHSVFVVLRKILQDVWPSAAAGLWTGVETGNCYPG